MDFNLSIKVVAVAATVVAGDGCSDEMLFTVSNGVFRTKQASIRRIKLKLSAVTRYLSEQEFKWAFRMTRSASGILVA